MIINMYCERMPPRAWLNNTQWFRDSAGQFQLWVHGFLPDWDMETVPTGVTPAERAGSKGPDDPADFALWVAAGKPQRWHT